jgi:DNA-binding CsgD family transcriptional regulator
MSTFSGESTADMMPSDPMTSTQTTPSGQVPTFATKNLGPNPVATQRILGLAVAHWSWGKIVDLGRYQGTWTADDVHRVLTTHKRRVPGMPGQPDHATHGGRPIPMNPTQRSIVTLLLEDTSDEDIAWELDISVKLVRKHIRAICNHAELRDRISLVLALTSGKIRPVDLDDSHG